MRKLWDRFYCWLFQIKRGWIVTPERMKQMLMAKVVSEEADKLAAELGEDESERFDRILAWRVADQLCPPIWHEGPRLADLKGIEK